MCVGTVWRRIMADSTRRGQVLLMIMQTMMRLRAGSTYLLYSQSVNARIEALMITMTEPSASAITWRNTPCIFI